MSDRERREWLEKILLDLTREDIDDAKKMLDCLKSTDADDRAGAAITLAEILYEGDGGYVKELDLDSDDPFGFGGPQ
jgi:hypothetical protein